MLLRVVLSWFSWFVYISASKWTAANDKASLDERSIKGGFAFEAELSS